MKNKTAILIASALLVCAGVLWLAAQRAAAHCDTLDGPVVKDARAALEKGDVTPVLKWIQKEHEAEIQAAFKKTLAVRAKGAEARELADNYFFETLVRIHRAGEGAPYTGLKPAGAVEPIVAAADKALEQGVADELVKHVSDAVAAGIRKRFEQAIEKKKHAEHSVDAGREFVAAYVEYVHYVERLHDDATQAGHAHGEPAKAGVEGHHHD